MVVTNRMETMIPAPKNAGIILEARAKKKRESVTFSTSLYFQQTILY